MRLREQRRGILFCENIDNRYNILLIDIRRHKGIFLLAKTKLSVNILIFSNSKIIHLFQLS